MKSRNYGNKQKSPTEMYMNIVSKVPIERKTTVFFSEQHIRVSIFPSQYALTLQTPCFLLTTVNPLLNNAPFPNAPLLAGSREKRA